MFDAKFGGRCGGCEEPVKPGQRVGYVQDVLMHAACMPAGPAFETWPRKASPLDVGEAEVVCTSCFLIKPCPCDDERSAA